MFGKVIFKDGRPIKPNTTTLQVNLMGALYSTSQFVTQSWPIPLKH